MSMLKVGDSVEWVKGDKAISGEKGKIVVVVGGMAGVKMDRYDCGRNSLGGECLDGYGVWCFAENIKIVEVKEEKMQRFKIGEKVKIVDIYKGTEMDTTFGINDRMCKYIGLYAFVERVDTKTGSMYEDGDHVYNYVLDIDGGKWNWNDKCLKKVDDKIKKECSEMTEKQNSRVVKKQNGEIIKIGNKVIATTDIYNLSDIVIKKGEKGTVLAVDNMRPEIGVVWDECGKDRHDIYGMCPEGHGWWCSKEYLDVIGDVDSTEDSGEKAWIVSVNGRKPKVFINKETAYSVYDNIKSFIDDVNIEEVALVTK